MAFFFSFKQIRATRQFSFICFGSLRERKLGVSAKDCRELSSAAIIVRSRPSFSLPRRRKLSPKKKSRESKRIEHRQPCVVVTVNAIRSGFYWGFLLRSSPSSSPSSVSSSGLSE